MQLVIISGRSGSGKSVALGLLEDLNFYCVDGLPIGLLPGLVKQFKNSEQPLAASIDVRNFPTDIQELHQVINIVKEICDSCKIIFLKADDQILLKRFSETRRKHPLTNNQVSLKEALLRESELLHPLLSLTDVEINTNHLTVHTLRQHIQKAVNENIKPHLNLLFQSFGYKNGLPDESDYVFDVRCLPNPFWEPTLRTLTGRDKPVIEFLEANLETQKIIHDITFYLKNWIPYFAEDNRQYLTIAIGCTGGQHRSVYVTEQIAKCFHEQPYGVQIRHRELR